MYICTYTILYITHNYNYTVLLSDMQDSTPIFSFISYISVQLSSCICALKYFAPKFNAEVVHFWRALIGRIYMRSILLHLMQLKHDSSVN